MTEAVLTVLVVEDDFLVSREVIRCVEQAGLAVAGNAANGAEAVKLVQELRPDVVLMDIDMPEMDGLTAARRLQDEYPVPVVLLTAHQSKELLEEARLAGVGAYLVKPPEVSELLRAVTLARARHKDLTALREANRDLEAQKAALEKALAEIRTLQDFLPICCHCKKVRDDEGYWHEVENYIRDHTDTMVSHGICPPCAETLYPGMLQKCSALEEEKRQAE